MADNETFILSVGLNAEAVVPPALIQRLGLKHGDALEFKVEHNRVSVVILKPFAAEITKLLDAREVAMNEGMCEDVAEILEGKAKVGAAGAQS